MPSNLMQDRQIFFIVDRWLEQHSKNFDVKLSNMTDEFGAIGLAGPKSREVLAKVTSSDLSDESFPFLSYQEITIGSVTVKAIRISYTGIHFKHITFNQDQKRFQIDSCKLRSE